MKTTCQSRHVVDLKQELQARYYNYVINNFFDRMHAVDMEIIEVNPDFINALAQRSESLRPEHRRSKTLDSQSRYGYLMPNLFDSPYEYTVELKPKWGWECLEDDSCKFCRLQPTRPYSIGKYCPVDLFSGNSAHIALAVDSLFENKRNQLRVYCKGKLCHDVPSKLQSDLASVLERDPILSRINAAQQKLYRLYNLIDLKGSNITETEYLSRMEQVLQSGALDQLSAFLLAISLEDLSLVISFDLQDIGEYQIHMIDIDIKLPTKLPEYVANHDWSRS